MRPLEGIPVAVLAGGLGTRIKGVLGDTPKVLAPIGGRTFLDALLDQLAALGAARVVLCLGHLAHKVVDHLAAHPSPLPVDWVIEDSPLGTAGALALAASKLAADNVLVMNGDTWLAADYAGFLAHHRGLGAAASLLCVPVDDVGRYGSVELDAAGWITCFAEKGGSGAGLINGGAFLLSAAVVGAMPAQGSLERDVLEPMPAGRLAGFADPRARFIDIGTPETLAMAGQVVGKDVP